MMGEVDEEEAAGESWEGVCELVRAGVMRCGFVNISSLFFSLNLR